MKKLAFTLCTAFLTASLCHADFKYTEKSQITGGTMMSMMKYASIFSKDARQSNQPQLRTVAVKGNRMREEHADGSIEVIDLDGRRFIEIDPKAKTYGVMTFEEFKQALLRAQERAKEEQAKMAAKHPEAAQSNLKITPKFETSETGATRQLLGLDTREVKARVEMQMESTDPRTQGQQMSTVINSDQWIAASVPGYDEIRLFYMKMASEMDWVPGAAAGAMGNPSIQIGMAELRRNNVRINGIPLLQTVSMTFTGGNMPAGMGPGPQSTGSAQTPEQQQPEMPSTQEMVTKAVISATPLAPLAGLTGVFGHKKKKEEAPPPAAPAQPDASATPPAQAPPPAAPAPAAGPSLMDMTIEVLSYSSSALDASLFAPPAGFTQVQYDPDSKFGGKRH
jgi:hypothetical protein